MELLAIAGLVFILWHLSKMLKRWGTYLQDIAVELESGHNGCKCHNTRQHAIRAAKPKSEVSDDVFNFRVKKEIEEIEKDLNRC